MPTLPSKEELKSMMYRDLQKICKEWGVQANLRSDKMINLLLEAQSDSTPVTPPPLLQTQYVPARRSSRSGSTRTSIQSKQFLAPESSAQVKQATKQQRRLGAGRPAALGTAGSRAVTRSRTVSQEKRLRSGRSIKELEAMTQESKEPAIPEEPSQEISVPSRARNTRSLPRDADRPVDKDQATNFKIPDYHKLLLDIVKPLQDQIDTLKAEVTRLQSLEPRFNALNSMMARVGHGETSTTEVQSPRPRNLSTPSTISNIQTPRTSMPSPHILTSPVQLGKRSRISPIRAATNAEDESEQEHTPGPVKKRLKSLEEISSSKGKGVPREESSGSEAASSIEIRGASVSMPHSTSFIVYNDFDDDLPPPNNLLPDQYMSRSDGPSTGRPTSSANASENQYPFNFSFIPEPSTPVPSLFMPAFPYPEPPQSPTPAGVNMGVSLGNVEERTDVFKPFGLPPPDRAGRLPTPSSDRTVNPTVLSRRDPSVKDRQSSSNEVGVSLGLIPSSPQEPDSNSGDVPAFGKTMYGTELGADSRFGDFGLESMAARFWSSGRI